VTEPPGSIEQLAIGADPAAWERAGFAVEGDGAWAGTVALLFQPGDGILGWRLGSDTGEIDGLSQVAPTELPAGPAAHPNGVTKIDHIVVFTPELERTTAALETVGLERRRVREVETDDGPLRQGFFRLGEVILEVVEHARVDAGPARFWGITFAVSDLDAAAELLGDRLGSIRDAVQPGRRIATVRREAGLGLPVALISAERGAD
jgi:hypothetical protein